MAEYIVTKFNVVVNKDMNLVCLTILYRLKNLVVYNIIMISNIYVA